MADTLLEPTRIYVQLMRTVLRNHQVHGIAHITGGGLLENVSRILPVGHQAIVQRDSWHVPPVFDWLKKLGDVDADEMDRVFNRGLGLVLVVDANDVGSIHKTIADQGDESWSIGTIAPGEGSSWA